MSLQFGLLFLDLARLLIILDFSVSVSFLGCGNILVFTSMFNTACTTDVTVTMSFGGKAWPISTQDMNTGPATRGSSTCLGAIFDLSMGTNIPAGSGNPNWVIGDTFLVSPLYLA